MEPDNFGGSVNEPALFRKARWGGVVVLRFLVGYDLLTGRRLSKVPCRGFGRGGGRWRVPKQVLRPGVRMVSAGLGVETSFEEALLTQAGVEIFGVDPTPAARSHGESLAVACKSFQYRPVGLWDRDEEALFHAPANPSHISHSLVALQGEAPVMRVPCFRWSTLLEQQGWQHADLLKMDVEGAEHRVVTDVLASSRLPWVICLEFDEVEHPLDRQWKVRLRLTVAKLEEKGYRVCAVVGKANVTFLRYDH